MEQYDLIFTQCDLIISNTKPNAWECPKITLKEQCTITRFKHAFSMDVHAKLSRGKNTFMSLSTYRHDLIFQWIPRPVCSWWQTRLSGDYEPNDLETWGRSVYPSQVGRVSVTIDINRSSSLCKEADPETQPQDERNTACPFFTSVNVLRKKERNRLSVIVNPLVNKVLIETLGIGPYH